AQRGRCEPTELPRPGPRSQETVPRPKDPDSGRWHRGRSSTDSAPRRPAVVEQCGPDKPRLATNRLDGFLLSYHQPLTSRAVQVVFAITQLFALHAGLWRDPPKRRRRDRAHPATGQAGIEDHSVACPASYAPDRVH